MIGFLSVTVNVVAVIVGSLIGFLLKKGIPKRISEAVMFALGLCVLFIGIQGAFQGQNTIILILSAAIGTVIGSLLKIDDKLNALGKRLEKQFAKSEDTQIARGFVSGTLLFCIGAMAITGSISAGIDGDNTIIYTKSVIDGISAAMFASTMGLGVALSAASILVYQGSLVLLARIIAPILTAQTKAEIVCVGSIMIIALGLNMLGVTKIKVADMLPGLLLPPLFLFIQSIAAPYFSLI